MVSFCIELFCVVTLQYQMLVRIAIAYFIIEKKKAAPQPWQAIAERFCSTGIEISYIPRDLITAIFYYQISLNPLKTQSLSQVSFPLLFPLCYIVPSVFTNSDKGKYKGSRCPVDICSVPTGSQRPVDVGSEPTVVERRAAAETKKII